MKPDNFCTKCQFRRVRKNHPLYPYCRTCYYLLHPDEESPKNRKKKEEYIVDIIRSHFPFFIWDKTVPGGLFAFRPDGRMDCVTHVVIIEIDENQHRDRCMEKEIERIDKIFEDCGKRPMIVLRLNPDGYFDVNGSRQASCFSFDKKGIMAVMEEDFNERMDTFMNAVNAAISSVPNDLLHVRKFYFDDE